MPKHELKFGNDVKFPVKPEILSSYSLHRFSKCFELIFILLIGTSVRSFVFLLYLFILLVYFFKAASFINFDRCGLNEYLFLH